MKKIITALLAIISAYPALSQLDTLYWGERDPVLYYWDTCWMDYYFPDRVVPDTQEVLNEHSIPYVDALWNESAAPEFARVFLTNEPLRIIGVAAPIGVRFATSFPTEDSTRLPEYFQLYTYDSTSNKMVMQRRARHDTLQPAGIIQMNQEWSGRNGPANYRRLYEAYFDQPIVVKDSFWISGTENNNYMTAIPEEAELDEITIIVWHDVKQAHPLTYYYTTIVQNCQECRCVPGYHYERFTFDDAFNHDTYRLHPNWWRDYGDYFPNDQMEIMFLFPIFDTTFTGEDTTTVEPPEHDTCLPSYGLRVTNYNPELPIVLWSTPYGVHQWDLSLARQGQSADEGEITHHTQTYTTFEGLDTGVWYTVWVRSVCDSGIVSVWSDSVDFYIAGDSVPSEPEGIVTADDIYTQFSPNPARESVTLFSSFQIRNVEAFDMGGKKVMELPARANNINIDIRSLAKGTYVVRVTTVHGVTVKKLIVE